MSKKELYKVAVQAEAYNHGSTSIVTFILMAESLEAAKERVEERYSGVAFQGGSLVIKDAFYFYDDSSVFIEFERPTKDLIKRTYVDSGQAYNQLLAEYEAALADKKIGIKAQVERLAMLSERIEILYDVFKGTEKLHQMGGI